MNTYAIVLYFHKDASRVLAQGIQKAADLTGSRYMVDVDIPPHVSLGCFLADEADGILQLAEKAAADLSSFSLTFDRVNGFAPRVLFASPVKDAPLTRANEQIHQLFSEHFPPADNAYYTPEKWVPHCALALRLDETQYEKGMAIQTLMPLPLTAQAQKLAVARCNPYQELAAWELR
jgi:2'-5' RNA ligase